MRWSPPFDRRRSLFHPFGWLTIVMVLAGAGSVLAADMGDDDPNPYPIPLYEIFVPTEVTEPILFRLHLPIHGRASEFFFESMDGQGLRPGQLLALTAVDGDDRSLPLHMAGHQFTVDAAGYPVRVDYELALHSSIVKPDTWPNNHPYSLRWNEHVYVTGNSLLRWREPGSQEAYVRFHVPTAWTVYAAGGSEILDGSEWIHVSDLDTVVLVLGPGLSPFSEGRGVQLIRAGSLPWDGDALLSSLTSMLLPLRNRGLIAADETYDFVLARYPGALRLNPFIGSRAIDESTFMQWVGIGSMDWWRKHTAADIVSARVDHTLNLAPEARWFKRGLVDYGGLLLLYEAGLLDVDGLYQSLRNMFVTAAHYAGPLWPSLIMAGLSEERSHDAERVLQFRAPVVAFLFDLELRERSDGRSNLLDWWASLAANQRQDSDGPLYNEDLLPPIQTFGDMSSFARNHLLLSSDLGVHFDDAFDRWLAQANR